MISTSSNVAPAEMVAARECRARGRPRRGRVRSHQRLLPLFDALFSETNPIPVKAAVAETGRCGEEIRLPLTGDHAGKPRAAQARDERAGAALMADHATRAGRGRTRAGWARRCAKPSRRSRRSRSEPRSRPTGHARLGATVEDGVRVDDDAKAAFGRRGRGDRLQRPGRDAREPARCRRSGGRLRDGNDRLRRSAELDEIAGHAARRSRCCTRRTSRSPSTCWPGSRARLRSDSARASTPRSSSSTTQPSATHRAAPRCGSGRPSRRGAAKQLADHLVLERAGEIGARPDDAIGIQTLRGGDNPGEHTVLFTGQRRAPRADPPLPHA